MERTTVLSIYNSERELMVSKSSVKGPIFRNFGAQFKAASFGAAFLLLPPGGQYTFTLLWNEFTLGSELIPTDRKTNILHKLNDGPYSFAHDQSFAGNRFVLHFDKQGLGISKSVKKNNAYVFTDNGQIVLHCENFGAGTQVEVYDVLGRKLCDSD